MIDKKITVGLGTCGIAAGAGEIHEFFSQSGLPSNVLLGVTSCIGKCYAEPLVDVEIGSEKVTYEKVDKKLAAEIASAVAYGAEMPAGGIPKSVSEDEDYFKRQVRIVLRNCGIINPESIEEYEKAGGYKALRRCIVEITPSDTVEMIKESGLRGRGGAGFPTGFKWEILAKAPGPEKVLVCNADEGDPGAFMDRSILEGDPHSVIEGITIAGYATGASEAFIYCRAEYPLAVKRLNKAILQAGEKNYLGKNILGSDFNFSIKVKEGAGAFVCGEETALMASIEGKRGMPRLRPPYPAESGINGRPTNINNVETYANAAYIISLGPEEFNKYASADSYGTKVFALAGKIRRGGLIEVPMGISIKEVVEEIGGGTSSGRPVKALQIGGPAGGCVPYSLFDTSIDYSSISGTGAIMGSGGLVVMDDTTCVVDVARYFLSFTQEESCGKCTFCRIGTKRMLELLNAICEGRGKPGDTDLLLDLAESIKKTSLCGLGQAAPNPVVTTIKYFREEYEEHIINKKCPAGVCTDLITVFINEKCTGCGACVRACPVDAINGERKKLHSIDSEICTRCRMCIETCRFDAIEVK